MDKDMLEQMKIDHEFMQSRDELWDIKKDKINNPILELNIRMVQYLDQFPSFSIQYLTYQSLHDFANVLKIVQSDRKYDYSKPVAIANGKVIYINSALVNRAEISVGTPVFILEKVTS